MKRWLVVGDVHGRHIVLRCLLERAGVVDTDGVRVRDPEVTTIQVGDLIHGTAKTWEDDAATLRKAGSWFDALCIGNHEHGYFGGGGFQGFRRVAEVERLVWNLRWVPAVAVGETLVTHAGVADLLGLRAKTADEAVRELSEAWVLDPSHPYFSATSGVLWRRAETRSLAFSQIHGHTPVLGDPEFVGNPEGVFAGNIDVDARRGRIAGLWLDEAGRPLDVLVAEPDSTPPPASERIAA